jgi:hypothetical protein
MKIVQIMTGQDEAGHVLLGLSDDGSLYEFHYATEARKVMDSQKVANPAKMVTPYRYIDGTTQGWKLICATGVMAKPVPHADDPSRCERC